MNISHHHTVGNSSKLFAASSTNQSQYLESDYFLPASYSENYYSRKYSRSISKISRIVSASLLSAMMLTATLDAKAHPSVESSILEPNQSFLFGKDSAGISTNVPLPPQSCPSHHHQLLQFRLCSQLCLISSAMQVLEGNQTIGQHYLNQSGILAKTY